MELVPDEPVPRPEAEVRYATVLKCDIVGSTELQDGSAIDDQYAFNRSVEQVIRQVAAAHGGIFKRPEGDGALVLFGYPYAREDAAESAVSMGLELVHSIRAATFVRDRVLRIRVGIASGELAVENDPDKDASHEDVAGIVIAKAERLRTLAEPDQVVICDATRRLAAAFFEYDDLGEPALKGFKDAVRAWSVKRPSAIASRFEAQRYDPSRSEILGRADALEHLAKAWSRARDGKGGVVYLVGEAGIGKSRLAKAVLDLASAAGATVLKLDCLPSTGNTPLFPVGVMLRRVADVTVTLPEAEKKARATSFLERILAKEDVPATVEYLAPLFGLQSANLPAGSTPDEVREKTADSVLRILRAQATQGPLALLCEDLHWSDDTTAGLVLRVAGEVKDLPVLIVVTSRPESEHLAKVANADVMNVQPLDRDTSSALVRSVAKESALPAEVLDKILERCEGNPLALEEVTRDTLDARSGGQAPAVDTDRFDSVPAVIKVVVQSRLGRRAELAPFVQAAAVLSLRGREFSVAALERMMPPAARPHVQQAFARTGLFAPWDVGTGDRAKFRHVMFSEAVHRMLMREDRRRLHSVAADILRAHFSGTTDASPEVLAEHLGWAERFVESIELRLAASADTAARGAYVETEGHCNSALELVDRVTPADLGRELHFKILLRLGVAATGRHGYASEAADRIYSRALAVCGEAAEAEKLYPIIRGRAIYNLVRGTLATAYDLSLRCLELAERSGRPEFLIDAMSVRCYTTLYFGKLSECRDLIDRCLELYRKEEGWRLTYPVPQDAGTAALAILPTVAWLQGDAQHAEDAIRDGLAHIDRLDREFDRAFMHAWIAGTRYTQRRYEEAQKHAMAAIGFAKGKYEEWEGTGTLMLLLAQAAREGSAQALEQATQVCQVFQSRGVGLNASYYMLGLARGHARLGQVPAAKFVLGEASRIAKLSEETRMDAEILLLHGELEPDDAAALEHLEHAHGIAENQGAVATSLRILATMAQRSGDASLAEIGRDALEMLERGPPYPTQNDWMRARADALRERLSPARAVKRA